MRCVPLKASERSERARAASVAGPVTGPAAYPPAVPSGQASGPVRHRPQPSAAAGVRRSAAVRHMAPPRGCRWSRCRGCRAGRRCRWRGALWCIVTRCAVAPVRRSRCWATWGLAWPATAGESPAWHCNGYPCWPAFCAAVAAVYGRRSSPDRRRSRSISRGRSRLPFGRPGFGGVRWRPRASPWPVVCAVPRSGAGLLPRAGSVMPRPRSPEGLRRAGLSVNAQSGAACTASGLHAMRRCGGPCA